jgi:hypothetical protein
MSNRRGGLIKKMGDDERNAAANPDIAIRATVAIGLGCTMLPISALAQTATPVDDPIKQLQSEIRNVQKHYETEIPNIQKQHESEIRNLQRQLDDLKAAQAAPKPAPIPPTASVAPAPGALAPLQIPPAAGILPPPVQAASPAPPAVTEAKRGGWLGSGIDLTLAAISKRRASTARATRPLISRRTSTPRFPSPTRRIITSLSSGSAPTRPGSTCWLRARWARTRRSRDMSKAISRAPLRIRTRSRATATLRGYGRATPPWTARISGSTFWAGRSTPSSRCSITT